MFKKLQNKIGLMALSMLGLLGIGGTALAAPSSTPTEVVDTVVSAGIDSVVSMVTTVVTTYFPYLIAFAVVVAIFTWVRKFATVGAK